MFVVIASILSDAGHQLWLRRGGSGWHFYEDSVGHDCRQFDKGFARSRYLNQRWLCSALSGKNSHLNELTADCLLKYAKLSMLGCVLNQGMLYVFNLWLCSGPLSEENIQIIYPADLGVLEPKYDCHAGIFIMRSFR